jgi:CelD/BcsL family acetyltransferase involved in cellulose biosynthesis
MLAAQSTSNRRMRRVASVAQAPTVVAVEHDFDFRSAQFLRLFQNSTATAFQHPLWLDAFYRLVAPGRSATKVVVTVRDVETGILRLVIPFIRRDTNGMTVIETADLGVSDHAAPIVARGWSLPQGIREDIAAVLPDHDLLRIRPVAADAVDLWGALFDADTHSTDFFGSATELSGPFPEWRSGAFGQAFRKHQDLYAPRNLKCGASEMRLLTDSAEIANAIEAIRLRREGRFEIDPIQARPVRDFYTTLAVAGSGAGFSRTYAIMQDDVAIGHLFAICWNGCFHYLLIGCDFERHGSHTTGLILHDAMVEDFSRQDSAVFKFTIDDEAFRQGSDRAASDSYVVTRASTWRGRLARAALDANDHVERMQRGTYIG